MLKANEGKASMATFSVRSANVLRIQAMPIHKCLILLPLIISCFGAKAQLISGKVVDLVTRQPIPGVMLVSSVDRRNTNENGEFEIKTSGLGDTIKMIALGYKHYILPVKQAMTDGNIVSLQRISIVLNQVNITASRNRRQDSINNRLAFAQVFNHHAPRITDVFVPPPQNVPFAWVSIDLLQVLGYLTRNSNHVTKLQKTLLKDEQANYIQSRYNKNMISHVTNLQGDSLQTFTDKYFPTADWLRKATDYELIQYVRTKAVEFRTARQN
ncbi:carboxypeptidase-like regulatory domain-containing protein [Mucilaginibacter agri]|uniref:Carboxypeptidase-like regulatory domain-containing protein n=1 Tax=Mucilaginibacter agri TaxID=2695265 RepID=A0A965ZF63_9SPHI|nr:carboxypeptidase-like regulatory domain-containing protein [Mucilaginibacter agri]NCD69933.1 hypothetical protein [Mucilaginibacter agri]